MNPNKLIEYNRWANDRTLASIAPDTEPNDRRLQLFGHIVGGLRLWLLRMQLVPYDNPEHQAIKEFVFPKSITWNECKLELTAIQDKYDAFCRSLDLSKLDEIVHFCNLAGVPLQVSMDEMVYHSVNHSTYHRGQIAQLVRAAGGTPAQTDHFSYVIEQRKQP